FLVFPIYVVIEQMDFKKMEASADLGANPLKTFWYITLPMTLSGVITGCILVFVASLGMFVVSDVMGGAKVPLIGNVIQTQFLGARNWPFGAALSLVLVVACILFIVIYYYVVHLKGKEKGGMES